MEHLSMFQKLSDCKYLELSILQHQETLQPWPLMTHPLLLFIFCFTENVAYKPRTGYANDFKRHVWNMS